MYYKIVRSSSEFSAESFVRYLLMKTGLFTTSVKTVPMFEQPFNRVAELLCMSYTGGSAIIDLDQTASIAKINDVIT